MHFEDYIAYTYQGRCFSRSYTRGSTRPPTQDEFLETLEFVLESLIPSETDEYDKWRNSLIEVLKKPKCEQRETLTIGKDEYERDLGGNDIAVEIDFDNNCIVLDGLPVLKLQPGGYPAADTLLYDYDRGSRLFYSLSSPLSHEYHDTFGYDIMGDSFRVVPPADPKALKHFDELQVDCQPIHTLLGLAAKESSCDIVCTKVREIYIGTYVDTFGLRILRWFVMNHPMEPAQQACARSLLGRFVAVAVLPTLLVSSLHFPSWPRQSEYWWIRSHICISLATHIHHEQNASAGIAMLVQYIRSKPNRPAVVFGVISSFTHCIIIRVSNQDTSPIFRTATLQFMPSMDATDPSTAGISALTRLGNLNVPHDEWFFYTALKEMWWSGSRDNIDTAKPPSAQPSNPITTDRPKVTILSLPLEIITEIGSYASTCLDLNSLAVTCKRTMSACIPFLRFPQLINTDPLCPNQHGYILTSFHSTYFNRISPRRSRLLAGKFVAKHGGKKYLVLLAMEHIAARIAENPIEFLGGYWLVVKGAFHLPSAAFPVADKEESSKMTFR